MARHILGPFMFVSGLGILAAALYAETKAIEEFQNAFQETAQGAIYRLNNSATVTVTMADSTYNIDFKEKTVTNNAAGSKPVAFNDFSNPQLVSLSLERACSITSRTEAAFKPLYGMEWALNKQAEARTFAQTYCP